MSLDISGLKPPSLSELVELQNPDVPFDRSHLSVGRPIIPPSGDNYNWLVRAGLISGWLGGGTLAHHLIMNRRSKKDEFKSVTKSSAEHIVTNHPITGDYKGEYAKQQVMAHPLLKGYYRKSDFDFDSIRFFNNYNKLPRETDAGTEYYDAAFNKALDDESLKPLLHPGVFKEYHREYQKQMNHAFRTGDGSIYGKLTATESRDADVPSWFWKSMVTKQHPELDNKSYDWSGPRVSGDGTISYPENATPVDTSNTSNTSNTSSGFESGDLRWPLAISGLLGGGYLVNRFLRNRNKKKDDLVKHSFEYRCAK